MGTYIIIAGETYAKIYYLQKMEEGRKSFKYQCSHKPISVFILILYSDNDLNIDLTMSKILLCWVISICDKTTHSS